MQYENAHGNMIFDVSSTGVSWPGGRYDRATGDISRSPWPSAFDDVDVHAGNVATMQKTGAIQVLSPAGVNTMNLEPGQFDVGLLRFNADGRYLAGYTTANGSYHPVVADTRTGEVSAPTRANAYPWIGWGYGDTLMEQS